jgi:hypothetical protein
MLLSTRMFELYQEFRLYANLIGKRSSVGLFPPRRSDTVRLTNEQRPRRRPVGQRARGALGEEIGLRNPGVASAWRGRRS